MNTRRLRRITTTLGLSAVFALGACQDEADVAAPTFDETVVLAAGLALPDAATLSQELNADEKQSQALAASLSKWQDAAVADTRPGRRAQPPLMEFLAEASTFLDHDQRLKLVQVLAAQRERRGEQRGERRQHRRGRAGDRPALQGESRLMGEFADELDLTDDQKQQLEKLQAEMREEMQAMRGDRPRRGGPDGEMREQATALRDQHREQVQSILTDEQQARLQELRAERRTEHQAANQERREARATQWLESLAVVLDLSQDQLEQIRGIMEAQQAKSEEIRDGFQAEAQDRSTRPTRAMRESHRTLFEKIREDGREQVREVLTEEQRELFDALETLRPQGPGHGGGHGRGHFGKGMGRGGHGPRH